MRKLGVLFLFILLMSGAAQASSLCGAKIEIADEALLSKITAAAGNVSALSGDAFGEKANKIYSSLKAEAANTETAASDVAAAFFQNVCFGLAGEAKPSDDAVSKLKALAVIVDNPPVVQGILQTLESGTGEKAKVAKRRFRGFNMSAAKEENKKEDGCAELGEIGKCSNIEDVIKSLKEANLKYNHPNSMYLGRKTQVSLILETTGEDQSQELKGLSGDIKTGKSKISRIMQAELSGADFKIEPSGPQKRTITTLAPVKWTWFVTPVQDGSNKRLNLELAAILREATREMPPVTIRTFKTEITVDVKWWDLALHKIKSLDPVYQLATAIGGVASALLLIWRVLAWGRRRG